MNLFAELKRRNVVRVGIAYVLIGWVLAQVAEFAFENYGAPDWVLKTFVALLLHELVEDQVPLLSGCRKPRGHLGVAQLPLLGLVGPGGSARTAAEAVRHVCILLVGHVRIVAEVAGNGHRVSGRPRGLNGPAQPSFVAQDAIEAKGKRWG